MFKNIFLSLQLLAFCFSPSVSSLALFVSQSPTEIIIKKGADQGNNPRQDVTPPISGYLISNTIYLTFTSNIGIVDVTIEESSAGVVQQMSIDSGESPVVIPFNATSGDYVLILTTISGVVYYGEFSI